MIPDNRLDRVASTCPMSEAHILAQLPCGVIAVDSLGRVALVNTIAESLWPALSAVTGPQPLVAPVEGWHVSAESLLAQALHGEPTPEVDIRVGAIVGGGQQSVRVVTTAMLDSNGRIVGATALCTILAEGGQPAGSRLRRDKDQQAANRELTRSNTELLQFASIASHDLQEPLRKILAFGDRLVLSDATTLTPRGKDSLDRMRAAAVRMQALINDLLMFSRVTTKALPFVPVNLSAVVANALGDLETQIARCAGRVVVGALPTIEADPLQMRQLMQNLISNALKFHRPDLPPEVTISAEVVDPPVSAPLGSAPWHHLVVRDNGIGFEQQYAERIFRIFERLHGRTEFEGTGIGLALCRQIIERHGGFISAEGNPDQGASFSIMLPARQENGAIA